MTIRLLAPLIVASLLVVLAGCDRELDEPIDCSDQCGEGCGTDEGFAFESYAASCADEGTDFCGTEEATAECVEPDFDVEEIRVAEIHAALEAGEMSCEWLTRRYIERVLWHDLYMSGSAPPLNAFVELNEGALETARQLDEHLRCEGELAGPLHCAPFVIKTNYASTEVAVTAGSHALMEAQPEFDAFTVRRLRRAGAVLLGSTTMDEFARGAQSLAGRSGKTGNAYDTRYNPGGSSSGSAVAVAANFAVAGLGTDNCSSLTVPAAYNGLATIRSSHRLVSAQGIFPSNQLDVVAGPMTRTVEDLARFFNVLSAFNPEDRNHCSESIPREEDYTTALNSEGLQGKRIGVLREIPQGERFPYAGASDEVDAHYEAFFEELRAQGAEVVDDVKLPGLPTDRSSSGMGQEVNRFLARSTGGASTVDEVCESELYSHSVYESVSNCKSALSRSDQNLSSRIEEGMEIYESNRAYVESVLDELELDALVYPADARGAPRISGLYSNCILASVTGLPTIVVPTGFTESGLPIGMSFTARMFEESTLFEIAYGYEQATMHRRPPQMAELEGEPPLDIEAFNELHHELGWATYNEVLRDQDRNELTYAVFADIARRVLETNGLEELLE